MMIVQKAIADFDLKGAAAMAARVFALLAGFVLFDRWLQATTHLDAEVYREPFILAAMLRGADPLLLAGLAAMLLAAAVRLGFRAPWSALEGGAALRLPVVLIAFPIVWTYTTYGYNFFFDQAHVADRAVLLALFLLTLMRPVFLAAFVFVAYVLMWQLKVPDLGGPVFAHKQMLLEPLTALAVWTLLRAAGLRLKAADSLFLVCCIVAGRYWLPGVAKVLLDWHAVGRIHDAMYAAYGHGWLGFLAPDAVRDYARIFKAFDGLLVWPVLIFEIGALVFLARRWWACGILAAAAVFHLGVFALMGFLFWTWIVVDLTLIWLFLRTRRDPGLNVFTLPHLALSIPLIGLSLYWSSPPRLSWFDTPLSYTVRFEAVGVSGAAYYLSPRFFDPYGDQMTFSFFGYLVEDRATLTGPYGATKERVVADAIAAATQPEDIFALEAAPERRAAYDPDRARVFYDFVQTYIRHWNARGHAEGRRAALQPPGQFWTFRRPGAPEAYDGQEPLREVSVKHVTSWFDGTAVRDIRTVELKRLVIDGDG